MYPAPDTQAQSPAILTDSQVMSLLTPDMDAAKAYQLDLSAQRERLYRIYRAAPYGNEVDGWSKVVHPTAWSAVEWLKPGLYEIFTGDFFNFKAIRKESPDQPSPSMVPPGAMQGPGGFNPQGAPAAPLSPAGGPFSPPMRRGPKPEDPAEKAAKRLKDYVRFKLFNQLDGEQLIDDGIHEALTSHYAIAKVTQREDYDVSLEPVQRISLAEIEDLQASDPEIVDIQGGQVVQEYDSTSGYYWEGVEGATLVRRQVNYTGFYLEIVPAAELYMLPGYPDLQKNPFVAHVVRRDLDHVKRMEMAQVYTPGAYDLVKDKVSSRDETSETATEIQTQYEVDGLSRPDSYGGQGSTNPMRRPANEVTIWECYCRLDLKGDGLLRPAIVTICEGVVLRAPVENPYGGPPFELGYINKEPFKIVGTPIPAIVENDQKVMTNLLRNIQDGAARSTYTGWLTSDAKAKNVLTNFGPGHVGYIPDLTKIQELTPRPPQQFIFNAFEMSNAEVSKRVGVNENQMGLDNNSLNKTAAGMNMRLTSGMMRQKLAAHRMARWWKNVLKRILKVISKFPPEDDVRFVGADIVLQPGDLDWEYVVDIEVGVGPQDRQAQAALMGQYMQMLSQVMIPGGMAQPAHFVKAADAMFEYQDMDVSGYHFDEEEIDAWGKMQQQMQQMGMQLQQAQGEAAGLKRAIAEHSQSMQQGDGPQGVPYNGQGMTQGMPMQQGGM